MIAEVDWAVLIPATISSFTGLVVVILTFVTNRRVRQIAPQVEAIDRAVNGQPTGTEHLVDKVSGIKAEQGRVAVELAESKRLDREYL